MNHSPASNTCDVCRHWDNDGLSPYGVCRKNPPTGSGWPRVSRKDWCGQFGGNAARYVAEAMVQPDSKEGVVPVIKPLPFYETVEDDSQKRRPGRPKKVQS